MNDGISGIFNEHVRFVSQHVQMNSQFLIFLFKCQRINKYLTIFKCKKEIKLRNRQKAFIYLSISPAYWILSWQSIPACTGQIAGHRAASQSITVWTQIGRHPLTFIPMDHLEFPLCLTCACLQCGRTQKRKPTHKGANCAWKRLGPTFFSCRMKH